MIAMLSPVICGFSLAKGPSWPLLLACRICKGGKRVISALPKCGQLGNSATSGRERDDSILSGQCVAQVKKDGCVMSDNDPFATSDEEKQAAMDRLTAMLSRRLQEAEILPMGFGEPPKTREKEPARTNKGAVRSLGSDTLKVAMSLKRVRQRRTMTFDPRHLVAFDAYCAVTGMRGCDVLSRIFEDFIATDDFQSVIALLEENEK